MNQHPANAKYNLDDTMDTKDQPFSSTTPPITQGRQGSENIANNDISSEELQTPDRPQTDQTAPKGYWQNQLQSIKGTVQEVLGVLIQDGDLESQGEQVKMDATKQLNSRQGK